MSFQSTYHAGEPWLWAAVLATDPRSPQELPSARAFKFALFSMDTTKEEVCPEHLGVCKGTSDSAFPKVDRNHLL